MGKVKLTDLRNDIDAVITALREGRNDGELPIDEGIARVRSELGDKILEAADQLIDLTLRKLIHDVGTENASVCQLLARVVSSATTPGCR